MAPKEFSVLGDGRKITGAAGGTGIFGVGYIGGTETWRPEDEEELDLPGCHLFVGAGGVKRSRGVGFLVHRHGRQVLNPVTPKASV